MGGFGRPSLIGAIGKDIGEKERVGVNCNEDFHNFAYDWEEAKSPVDCSLSDVT